ncbi:MAG: hypothetical protein J2P21_03100 [Chloracidobacterium sp.]|nr:hypothetical protein [Chloracidobacterium sp.]
MRRLTEHDQSFRSGAPDTPSSPYFAGPQREKKAMSSGGGETPPNVAG